ncbi:MAG TPA: hypothetical protein VMD28_01905, partial [Acidimicrobiales bacterium]|nr:hypothetical protein [Acidimicrobiales bacterium]
NYVEIVSTDGSTSDRFGKVTARPVRRGELVRIVTGAGGGWGDPAERDPALVAADVDDGYAGAAEADLSVRTLGPADRPTGSPGSPAEG